MSDEEIANVLLNQRVMAGIGNIWKSEALFRSGVDPFTLVRDLDDDTLSEDLSPTRASCCGRAPAAAWTKWSTRAAASRAADAGRRSPTASKAPTRVGHTGARNVREKQKSEIRNQKDEASFSFLLSAFCFLIIMSDASIVLFTLAVASVSTIAIAPFALALAAWSWRAGTKGALLDAVAALPLVLPPTAVGFVLLELLSRNRPLGRFLDRIGIDVVFTPKAVVSRAR